jgi:potassium/chloride transporter 9
MLKQAQRFLDLKRLLRKSRKRHNMSNLKKLGVSFGMRSQRLEPDVISRHAASASEDSGSDSEYDTESEADDGSVASEGDLDDFESDTESIFKEPGRLVRRRSHGDSMRGPPISKRAAGEKEPVVPTLSAKRPPLPAGFDKPATVSGPSPSAPVSPPHPRPSSPIKRDSISNLTTTLQALKDSRKAMADSATKSTPSSHQILPPKSARPPLSRHTSTPKFSSKPVPITRVATEDGLGPSIMFADTPSPPTTRKISQSRIPSAYQSSSTFSQIPESPGLSRRSSSYSLQSVPISFNDLPCRAQHLILNQLIRSQSEETAVIFTTLPSPVEGTGLSEEGSKSYLGDLEVLCQGLPPVLLVHSNSMTVTVSL